MSMTLQTERLILRRPEPGDWGAFRAFMLSDRSSLLGSTQDVGKAWRAFAAELGHWEIRGYGMWAVTLRGDNDAVGLVGSAPSPATTSRHSTPPKELAARSVSPCTCLLAQMITFTATTRLELPHERYRHQSC